MNKFYIKFFFFLLIISLCVNNKTLATELAPKTYTKHKPKKFTIFKSKKSYPAKDNTEEIYQKNKHLLYTDPEETIKACRFMTEALTHLEHHATSIDGYKLYNLYYDYNIYLYKKKHRDHTNVEKIEYTIDDPNKYNKLINKFWDPDSSNFLYAGSVKTAKFKISENKTMIVMASANIIDHNRKNKKYFENKIIENANLFQAEIDSEDDIRNGKLIKMFVNLNGYIVEKKNKYIEITYNDEHGSI
ncbi:fam-a protein [Plasmodium yoelii yoelii]|uniref:Fam-a protein n=1 Tax=Plasmodium yoelii yoelii TaxID=73239 RepID=A0AAF0B3C9_PLAYO|nr:fam-a protein [Plasmodium yoelii yoelii]